MANGGAAIGGVDADGRKGGDLHTKPLAVGGEVRFRVRNKEATGVIQPVSGRVVRSCKHLPHNKKPKLGIGERNGYGDRFSKRR
jgi:hypothetical protein